MARKFITTLLAAAVTVTAFGAAPAKATDLRDLAGAAAGIAAVAIIAHQYNQSRDRGRETTSSRHQPQYYAPAPQRAPQHAPIYRAPQAQHFHQPAVKPRPLPPRVAQKALPAACVQSVADNRGRAYNVLGQRCLHNNYRNARALPQHCTVDLRTNRGWQTAYDATCLSRAGYSIARY